MTRADAGGRSALDRRAKIAEKISREEYQIIDALLSMIADGVLVCDGAGRPTIVNAAAERILGVDVKAAESLSSAACGFFRSDGTTSFPDGDLPHRKALSGETCEGVELFVRNPRVPYGISIAMSARPIFEDNAVIGAVVTFRDVSVHKQLEEELGKYTKELEEKVAERTKELDLYLNVVSEERAKHKALLESIGDGVIAVGADGNVTFINQAGEQLLGIAAEEAVGKPFPEVVRAEDEKGNLVPDEERLYYLTKTTQRSTTGRYTYIRKDGTRFPAAITVSPIILGGATVGFVNTFRDISEERRIERAKDEIISLASHQLRTPPTGIKWFTEMLLAGEVGPVNEDQRAYLEEIAYNNQRMIDVVNEMLNVSRISLGTFRVAPIPTDPAALVRGVLGELAIQVRSKKLDVATSFEEIEEGKLYPLDPVLLRIILQNLLYNAVKYTPEKGSIAVTLAKKGERLECIVTDTGCGIPEEAKDKIFAKLFRAANAREVDPSGTGLGLYITKQIVDEMGGTIAFTSSEGKGTTFTVNIPLIAG